jgi:nitrite reductase (NADH) small subunit
MSAQMRWIRAAACADFPLREGRAVEIGGRQIAVFNLGDRFAAVENQCPHKAGPLADGLVSGESVVCPLHAWKIDLTSGKATNHPEHSSCVATFETRVEDDALFLAIPADSVEPPSPSPIARSASDRPLR